MVRRVHTHAWRDIQNMICVLLRIQRGLHSPMRSSPLEAREDQTVARRHLLFLCWLGQVHDVQDWKNRRRHPAVLESMASAQKRTWRKTLPEFLSLVWIVDGEGVQISLAPYFELGLSLAGGGFCSDLLYPCLYKSVQGKV